MKILAYESSQNSLSVAVTNGKKVLTELQSEAVAKHSDALIPLVEKILRKVRVRPSELDFIALGVGPGSFTGIRVGVATAKMLAWVWEKKIVAVSSLECIAFSAGRDTEGPVAALMDARKGNVYAALYKIHEGKMKVLIEPQLTTAELFLKRVRTPARFAGNDELFLKSLLPRGTENIYVDQTTSAGAIKASTVAEVALGKIIQKKFVSAEKLKPLYLHPRDCNVTKKK